MSNYSKLAFFVGGALFGTVGMKILKAEETKTALVRATALGLRVKDCAMETVTTAQENAADILAAAKDLNEERAAKAAAADADAEIEDVIDEIDAAAEELENAEPVEEIAEDEQDS